MRIPSNGAYGVSQVAPIGNAHFPALNEVGKEERVERHAPNVSTPRDSAHVKEGLTSSSPTLDEVGQERSVG